jgi:hypothetical protein
MMRGKTSAKSLSTSDIEKEALLTLSYRGAKWREYESKSYQAVQESYPG